MKTWDDVKIGDSFGPLSYKVSTQANDRFYKVTRADNSWYRDTSPYGGPIVPSTLPSGDDFPLIGVELETGVHAKHYFRLYQPLLVGDEATAIGTVTDKYLKRGYRYMVFDYTLQDAGGKKLCANRITFAIPPDESTGDG